MHTELERKAVLVIDDQVGEIKWLIDRIEDRGYEVVLATNEADGRKMLDEFKAGRRLFLIGIFDVMMATKDMWALIGAGENLDKQFFESSKDSGLRLCRYARKKLGLSSDDLPIACLTVRRDAALRNELRELEVAVYPRLDLRGRGIMEFVDVFLPP